jgi:hypothetical protein
LGQEPALAAETRPANRIRSEWVIDSVGIRRRRRPWPRRG